MKYAVPLAIMFFFASTLSLAQQRKPQSLSYSDVHLKLGDQEQTTVERLRDRYLVNQLQGDKFPDSKHTNYIVQKKSNDHNMVGVITFRNGKLVKAYRDWTPDEMSPYALVRALRGAIESVKDDGLCK